MFTARQRTNKQNKIKNSVCLLTDELPIIVKFIRTFYIGVAYEFLLLSPEYLNSHSSIRLKSRSPTLAFSLNYSRNPTYETCSTNKKYTASSKQHTNIHRHILAYEIRRFYFT